jgi:hypothetical protein
VGEAIAYVTGSSWSHTAICLGDVIYDDTIWHQKGKFLPISGVRMTLAESATSLGKFTVLDPVVPWSEDEVDRGIAAAIAQVNTRQKYNMMLLLADIAIYPLRKLWTKLKWVPFKDWYFGGVCSTFVGLVVRGAGRDPWPGVETQCLVPGDYITNPAWAASTTPLVVAS